MKIVPRQQSGVFLHKFVPATRSFEGYLGFCDGSDAPWGKISIIMNLQNFTFLLEKQCAGSANAAGEWDEEQHGAKARSGYGTMADIIGRMHGE